jgi:hypothetical protein
VATQRGKMSLDKAAGRSAFVVLNASRSSGGGRNGQRKFESKITNGFLNVFEIRFQSVFWSDREGLPVICLF